MNNPITHCLSLIFNSVPHPILIEAFIPKDVVTPNTLDYYIRKEVIEGRVLLDCNLYAGKPTKILLTSDMLEEAVPFKSPWAYRHDAIYRIPPKDREYMDIAEVIEVRHTTSPATLGYMDGAYGQTAYTKAKAVIDSHTFADASITPRPIKEAGDLVRLVPPVYFNTEWLLVALLEYDKNFTNLNNAAIRPLSEMVLCATKAYCYNKLILAIDNAYIVGGQELGRFKEIVDRYESEEEKYKELLLNFRGGSTSDPEILNNVVSLMFG